MPKIMKFGYMAGKGNEQVAQRELPELGPGDVLIKQLGCNICTTDYDQWLGLREHQGYPMAGGHEGAGIVEAISPDVSAVKVGDFVAMALPGTCGVCEACKVGKVFECAAPVSRDAKTADGYIGSFGFANYNIRKERDLFIMNKDLDEAEACFLEPVATVVKGMKKLRATHQETVIVIGAGTMGMLNAQVARAYACNVIITELMPKKIAAAREMGFKVIDSGREDPAEAAKRYTNGKGADAVIVAVGNAGANRQALSIAKKVDGRILFFAAGYPAPQLDMDSNLIHYRRMELIGTFGSDFDDYIESAKLLNTRAIDVSKIIEPTRYKLDDIQKAFKAAATPGMYRVNITLQD